jgi:hypothetical protein
MNNYLLQQIFEYLTKTTELLASEGYKLAYKKAIYWGVVDLVMFVILLIVAIVAFKYIKKYCENNEHDEPDKLFYTWVGGFMTICIAGWSIGELFCALDWLINTELGAIKLMLSVFK